MRLDFYRLPERRARLALEAAEWLGTPFANGSAVKGRTGGVDCVRLLESLHIASGAMPQRLDFPSYDPDHGIHSPDSLILEYMAQPEIRARVRKVEDDEAPLCGDILLCEVGQAIHHAATRVGGRAWHVARNRGVYFETIDSRTLLLKIRAVYRITEL